MNTDWVNILKGIGYPTDVCVLDFETYFDKDYTLSKISTVEYLADPRFSIVGLAELLVRGDAPHVSLSAASKFWAEREGAAGWLRWLQERYGQNFEGLTVIVQNALFDVTILKREFGIRPRFVVDTKDLANYVYPGFPNRLKNLCERLDLKAKGDTKQFLGYNWVRHPIGTAGGGLISMPKFSRPMSDALKQLEIEYACNDAEREFEVFTILLPQVSNPAFELALAYHTHGLFVEPKIGLDFKLADEIVF